MKRFHFPLERVLGYRQTQARMEEAKLERLHAELRAIRAAETALWREREAEEQSLVSAPSATGTELAALAQYRFAAARRLRQMEHARAQCNQRIAAQMLETARARRAARLLEKLRDRRAEEWTRQAERQLQREADEAFLMRWERR
jgi:flagellar biosynthesis chaperone FliJ